MLKLPTTFPLFCFLEISSGFSLFACCHLVAHIVGYATPKALPPQLPCLQEWRAVGMTLRKMERDGVFGNHGVASGENPFLKRAGIHDEHTITTGWIAALLAVHALS
jgi:hypothetical protein